MAGRPQEISEEDLAQSSTLRRSHSSCQRRSHAASSGEACTKAELADIGKALTDGPMLIGDCEREVLDMVGSQGLAGDTGVIDGCTIGIGRRARCAVGHRTVDC